MEIKRPTLLIDQAKCQKNICDMLATAQKSGAMLRPHFKTHLSAEVAGWYREAGIDKCTVSSVSMAQYFATHGWQDISIAFPYNPLEHEEISDLAKDIRLNLCIVSQESLDHAEKHLKHAAGYFIKIDVGTKRTGIDRRNTQLIASLVQHSSPKLHYQGFMAHAGHTYGAKEMDDLRWIVDGAEKTLTELKSQYGGIISYGDTPSCSRLSELSFCDELRPGNFIFFDWMQHTLGSCSMGDIAVCMAAPIVAVHKDRNALLVQAGGVHLSKDFVMEGNKPSYGKAVRLSADGWQPEVIGNVARLSQEHGIIQVDAEEIDQWKIGDLIGILPAHSCLAADLQSHYRLTTGARIEKMSKS